MTTVRAVNYPMRLHIGRQIMFAVQSETHEGGHLVQLATSAEDLQVAGRIIVPAGEPFEILPDQIR